MEDWPREPELSSASAGNSLDNLAQVTLPSRRATIGTEWRRSFKVESARICPGWFRSGRFLTPHRRRKKRPPTRSITSDQALLDDLYIGPTHTLLERINEWPFNAFALNRSTGGRPLPTLCFHLFHYYGLVAHFHLDPVKVWKFFTLVEEGYHSNNPYHNAIHATDVTQAMHCFLQEEKMRTNLTPLEIASSLIAAMAHDLDHPGVNQPFLVATSNHLASLYKNASVLENHHWRSVMACLMESGLIDSLDRSSAQELQRQIQSLILATDIARQQEFLTAFQVHLDNNSLDLRMTEHRHFMLQIALKCADISNPCRPWAVSRAWSLQVCEEFYRQGDLERRLGLPVTPLCDRYSSSVSKIQIGFFRFIVSPLFEQWHRFHSTPLSLNMLNYLRSNKLKWDAILSREESGEPEQHEEWQPNESFWPELGSLETGIERIHLRRASFPEEHPGPWSSNLAGCPEEMTYAQGQSCEPEDDVFESDHADESTSTIPEFHPYRSEPALVSPTTHSPEDPVTLQSIDATESSSRNALQLDPSPELLSVLPTRLPQRLESLPLDFPDRTWMNQDHRESFPINSSSSLNVGSIFPERSCSRTKATTASLRYCIQTPTSVPFAFSDTMNPVFTEEKENVSYTANVKSETSRSTMKRGSTTIVLQPLKWMKNSRENQSSTSSPSSKRHGSLSDSNCSDVSELGLRRRGSLPYGRPGPPKCCLDLDLGPRRGSAPCDLLRNTSPFFTDYFVRIRDRVKMKAKEFVVRATVLGIVGDPAYGLNLDRKRRPRSLRRHRSGGPEFSPLAIHRVNTNSTSSLSPTETERTEASTPSVLGVEDARRDWRLLDSHDSDELELFAGLCLQNRDRSEYSSPELDEDPVLRRYHERQSIDLSSDGLPSFALGEYCHLIGYARTQRRGSCPVDHSSLLIGSSKSNVIELNSR